MTTSNQPLPQQIGHDNQLTTVNPTSNAAAQHLQDRSATTHAAPAKTGAGWFLVFDRLLSEIKIRHYSPKTVKAYRGWTRQFQGFTKSKDYNLLS